MRPAVGVGADQGADPLPEGIVVGGRLGRRAGVQQVAVGGPFRGEHPAGREVRQPGQGDVVGGQLGAVLFEQLEGEQGEVEVVVLRHAVDVLDQRGRRRPPVPRPPAGDLGRQPAGGEVAGDRPVPGGAGDLLDARTRDLLHRLAEQAARRPSVPGASHPVAIGSRRPGQPRGRGQQGLDGRPVVGFGDGVRLQGGEFVQQLPRHSSEAGRGGLGAGPGGWQHRIAAVLDPATFDGGERIRGGSLLA